MRYPITLHRCSRTDHAYKVIRDQHYIPNRGCIGAQLHYLIELSGQTVGVISGAIPAFHVKTSDLYFGLSADPGRKGVQLRHLFANNVFRLEVHPPNLGSIDKVACVVHQLWLQPTALQQQGLSS